MTAWAVVSFGCGGNQGLSDPQDGESTAAIVFRDVISEVGMGLRGPTYAAAAADFNRDGRPDLAVSRHGWVALFENLGGGRFAEVDGVADGTRADTHGLSWFDLDRDGWLDMHVSIGAARGFGRGPNLVLRNTSGGALEVVDDIPAVLRDPMGRGRCTCPADVTGDGIPELMVLNAPQRDRPHRLAKLDDGMWVESEIEGDLARMDAECARAVATGDGDNLLVAYGSGSDSGRFFRWTSTGALEDVTDGQGVSLGGANVTAVASGDVDNDGDLDLYLVRGRGIPTEVHSENGVIRFRLVAHDPGMRRGFVVRAEGSIELDAEIAGRRRPEMVQLGADRHAVERLPWRFDIGSDELSGVPVLDTTDVGLFLWREGDRLVALFVGDGARFRAAAGRVAADGGATLVEQLHAPAPSRPTPNTLLERRGGRYVDITASAGVGDPGSGRDAVFADVDNDGDLDLYLVNGGTAFVNQPDRLYRNDGGGRFTDVTRVAGVEGPAEGRGASALAFDMDGDGALDLFATNGDGPSPGNDGPWTLFKNESDTGRWAEVDLVGPPANPFAMGATIVVSRNGTTLAMERSATTGRFSTGVLPFHIGLGDAEEAGLDVVWPSGRRQAATVRAGQRLVLTENEK